MTKPRIVIYASSLFAWPCIEKLQQTGQLVGVITPDPSQYQQGKEALLLLLNTLATNNIAFEAVCKEKLHLIPSHLSHFTADLALVMGFRYRLPSSVLSHYPRGIINCHASKLPEYAGRDPIYWQIRNQETHSALTWHHMSEQLDSGQVVLQEPVMISAEDTYASLTQRFAYLALHSLDALLNELGNSQQQHVKSVSSLALPPPHIDLDFSQFGAGQIDALTRASNGHFGRVLCKAKGMHIEVIQATAVDYPNYGVAPGTVVMISQEHGLVVSSQSGCVRLDILACELGVLSGERLAHLIHLDAGERLNNSEFLQQQA
ncbi:Methionyl-tRNA formyltransferase [Pseudoalteromonas sp. THAF3]|uniref:methionyl-tRNA formyltransferase n=1 Tax=Pseudoalteromonas sp. THAF3 TaxID=2587843 RepID=UPI00126878F6|nr:formyltransferase family protein [Pseudoalteromonas sp. THAF3]QFU04171.1 Methionyl-tRNA formyltransferase [Pseudoalteromonas sp. THAF3]